MRDIRELSLAHLEFIVKHYLLCGSLAALRNPDVQPIHELLTQPVSVLAPMLGFTSMRDYVRFMAVIGALSQGRGLPPVPIVPAGASEQYTIVSRWTVEQVCAHLPALHGKALAESFRQHRVCGDVLLGLDAAVLTHFLPAMAAKTIRHFARALADYCAALAAPEPAPARTVHKRKAEQQHGDDEPPASPTPQPSKHKHKNKHK